MRVRDRELHVRGWVSSDKRATILNGIARAVLNDEKARKDSFRPHAPPTGARRVPGSLDVTLVVRYGCGSAAVIPGFV